MTMSVLLKKLQLEGKEFVTAEELKRYCKTMKLDYGIVVRYFGMRGYLIRIFRGIFYVKSPEELKLGRNKYNHLELVVRGLELKKVRNWYFGLHTALKLNNMTHEHFAVEDVVNDLLFRASPVTIAGHKFKFVKLSPSLMAFGLSKGRGIRYSDPEKTILDFVYLWRYRGVPDEKIVADISEYAKNVSRDRLRRYAKSYPKSMAKIVERVAG